MEEQVRICIFFEFMTAINFFTPTLQLFLINLIVMVNFAVLTPFTCNTELTVMSGNELYPDGRDKLNVSHHIFEQPWDDLRIGSGLLFSSAFRQGLDNRWVMIHPNLHQSECPAHSSHFFLCIQSPFWCRPSCWQPWFVGVLLPAVPLIGTDWP